MAPVYLLIDSHCTQPPDGNSHRRGGEATLAEPSSSGRPAIEPACTVVVSGAPTLGDSTLQ
jgi:hypothetical protein